MTAKRSSNQDQTNSSPKVSRPKIPTAYGVPKHNKGLLPWSHVSERMAKAPAYWVCTVSADGRPHAIPVDGVWIDDRLYFGGDPQTRWHRNLAANAAVSIHLDGTTEAVILHGDAHAARAVDHTLAVRLAEATQTKYGYPVKSEDYEKGESGMYEFRPHVVFAWMSGMKDATRWEFPTD